MSIRPPRRFLDLAAVTPPAVALDADAEIEALQPGDRAVIRYETFSPREEYAVREGRTEPLDEEFHAVLSMDYKGAGTVTANGILIKDARLVGYAYREEGVTYWHPDSDLCNRVASGPIEVNYTYNPARPEVVHLWSTEWVYLETLPARPRVNILDNATLAAAGKAAKRQIKRFTDTLQDLHAADSQKAIDDLCHNASEMPRAVVSMDLPAETAPQPRAKREVKAATGFEKARRDTGAALETHHHNRALVAEVEDDLAEIHSHRRNAMDMAEIDEDILDPLDAL